MRTSIIAAFATLSAGCATAPPPTDPNARAPATTVVRAAPPSDLMTQHFADAAAVQAVLQLGPDARAACQVELYDHPELTPRFLTSTPERAVVPLGLKHCPTPRQNQIFNLVMGRDAAAEPFACAWNDGWAAAHAGYLRARPPRRRERHRRTHAREIVPVFKALECASPRSAGDATVTYLLGPAHEAGRDR